MQKKYTFLFLILIVVATLLIIGLSAFGLGSYSAFENDRAMDKAYKEINEVVMESSDGLMDYEALEEIVEKYSETYNFSITVYNTETDKPLVTSERDNEQLIQHIRESIFTGKESKSIRFEYCDDNKTLVAINLPQESVKAAVSTSNRWIAYITLMTLLIVCLCMYIFGRRFSKVEELEKENEKLRISLEEKDKQNEIQKQFVSSVSHELKTPLTLIEGYAEALKGGLAADEKTRDEYCETIVDEASRMDRIVKQLLLLSSIESGTEQIIKENFDFSEMVEGITESTQILADKKGAVIEKDIAPDLYINADEFKMESVVTNYLQNAINHVTEGGTIKVTLKPTQCTGTGCVRLSVFNTGENIPEEVIGNIWDKFFKVDKARTRTYGGSGIGLSIVKAVMDAHGGNCGVRNLPDGVEFFLTI